MSDKIRQIEKSLSSMLISEKNNEYIELLKSTNIPKYIAKIISEIVLKNKEADYNSNDPFSTENASKVTVEYYIERLKKYTGIENSTMILLLIYADRLCAASGLILEPHNVHRIILACTVLAIKYNEDSYYANDFYAKVGGVSLHEINDLEFYLTDTIGFDFFVDEELFGQYVKYLKKYLKGKENKKKK